MDQLLSSFPKTQCIIDDIIVTGETDDEHIRNLEMVLQRLLDAGSGRTLRRRDSSMPRPNTAAMQSALTDCTSSPPR